MVLRVRIKLRKVNKEDKSMNKRFTIYDLRFTNPNGFTLIELLVVIAIIAVLVAFSVANFVGARSRARDVKKKSEMQEVKNALRLFYNEYNSYPGPATASNNTFNGCGALTTPPSSTCGTSFSAGAGPTIYLKYLPQASEYVWHYQQITSDEFCLWTTLENLSDADIARTQTRCSAACSTVGFVPATDYIVCAD
jgi:prepilin-type N-terminal cleavage/methylation domain-containing protein